MLPAPKTVVLPATLYPSKNSDKGEPIIRPTHGKIGWADGREFVFLVGVQGFPEGWILMEEYIRILAERKRRNIDYYACHPVELTAKIRSSQSLRNGRSTRYML